VITLTGIQHPEGRDAKQRVFVKKKPTGKTRFSAAKMKKGHQPCAGRNRKIKGNRSQGGGKRREMEKILFGKKGLATNFILFLETMGNVEREERNRK